MERQKMDINTEFSQQNDYKIVTFSFIGDRDSRDNVREKLEQTYKKWQFMSYVDSPDTGTIRFCKKISRKGREK